MPVHGREDVLVMALGLSRRIPTWIDSLLFLALMSGPPKFRDRDMRASLAGEIDSVVLLHIVVWGCGGLWVAARVFPLLMRRGAIPALNTVQMVGLALIVGLSFSIVNSPGMLLTVFTLGQFAVMLTFAWLFVQRYGASSYLRHLFAGLCFITLMLLAAAVLTPDMVIVAEQQRFRGERIASTGAVAAMGLVFCLSNVPRLRAGIGWGLIALFGILLAWSKMRTGYLALLAFLLIGWLFGQRLRIRKFVPVLMTVPVALAVLDAIASTAEYIVRDTKSIESMSDRLPLWSHLAAAVMRDEPLIGMGYYSASRVLAPVYNSRLGTAHSVFFEMLVGGGMLGATLYLILCALLLLYAGRLLLAAGGRSEVVATVGLLAVVMVLGIASSEGAHAGPVGFTFWSMTALLPTMYRRALTRYARQRWRLERRTVSLSRPLAGTSSFTR